MAQRNYRRYQRFVVPEDRLASCEAVGRALDGKVAIVGLGGIFIRTRETWPPGTLLKVSILCDGDLVEAKCVVRRQEPDGLGAEFVKLRGKHEERLKKFMASLKG